MKNIILFIAILALLAGCRSPQQIADRKCAKALAKYENAAYRYGCPLAPETDTVIKQLIIRETHDTTITVTITGEIKQDSVIVVVNDGIVNSQLSRLDTKYAYATAQVINSELVLKIYQKQTEIPITLKDVIQKTTSEKQQTITKVLPGKVTNVLKGWQVVLMYAGGISGLWLLVFFIVFLRLRLIKK
jgi:hypothetical protein